MGESSAVISERAGAQQQPHLGGRQAHRLRNPDKEHNGDLHSQMGRLRLRGMLGWDTEIQTREYRTCLHMGLSPSLAESTWRR